LKTNLVTQTRKIISNKEEWKIGGVQLMLSRKGDWKRALSQR